MPVTLVLRHGETAYRVAVLDDRTVRLEDGRVITPPARAAVTSSGDVRWVFLDGETYEFQVERGRRPRAARHTGSLSAPMPATVLRIQVRPGDRVTRGETLIVLEAMKMELPVRAPSDAVVVAVQCSEGDLVQPGVSLIELQD